MWKNLFVETNQFYSVSFSRIYIMCSKKRYHVTCKKAVMYLRVSVIRMDLSILSFMFFFFHFLYFFFDQMILEFTTVYEWTAMNRCRWTYNRTGVKFEEVHLYNLSPHTNSNDLLEMSTIESPNVNLLRRTTNRCIKPPFNVRYAL